MSVRTAASASARVGRSGRVAAAEWPRERLLLTTLSIRVLRPPARQASYARLSGGNVNKPATFAPTTPGACKGYATFIAQTPRQASNEIERRPRPIAAMQDCAPSGTGPCGRAPL